LSGSYKKVKFELSEKFEIIIEYAEKKFKTDNWHQCCGSGMDKDQYPKHSKQQNKMVAKTSKPTTGTSVEDQGCLSRIPVVSSSRLSSL
jgi:hypothetical protein